MKSRDIREKTTEELDAALRASSIQVRDLHFNLAAGRVKNVKEAATIRRTIARIKTEITSRKQKQKE